MHSFIHPPNQFAERLLPAQRFAGGRRCCHDLGDAPAFMGIRVYRGCTPLIGQRLASMRRRQREARRGISLGRTELCRPLTDSPSKASSRRATLSLTVARAQGGVAEGRREAWAGLVRTRTAAVRGGTAATRRPVFPAALGLPGCEATPSRRLPDRLPAHTFGSGGGSHLSPRSLTRLPAWPWP